MLKVDMDLCSQDNDDIESGGTELSNDKHDFEKYSDDILWGAESPIGLEIFRRFLYRAYSMQVNNRTRIKVT